MHDDAGADATFAVDDLEPSAAQHGQLALCTDRTQPVRDTEQQQREIHDGESNEHSLRLHGRLRYSSLLPYTRSTGIASTSTPSRQRTLMLHPEKSGTPAAISCDVRCRGRLNGRIPQTGQK